MNTRLITAVYRRDKDNGGDMAVPPHNYFVIGAPVIERDIGDRSSPIDGTLIVGGGGLFHWPDHISWLSQYPGKKVVWGAGTNTHNRREACWPDSVRSYDLVGLRDWGNPFRWVPCASCMSPLFDNPPPPEHEVVVFDHLHSRTPVKEFPALTNRVSMQNAVAHLASGDIIITSSYHGAYWGMLLGRKVIVANPFSSRFYHYRHQPAIIHGDAWASASPARYPHALEECRQANKDFYQDVVKLLTAG